MGEKFKPGRGGNSGEKPHGVLPRRKPSEGEDERERAQPGGKPAKNPRGSKYSGDGDEITSGIEEYERIQAEQQRIIEAKNHAEALRSAISKVKRAILEKEKKVAKKKVAQSEPFPLANLSHEAREAFLTLSKHDIESILDAKGMTPRMKRALRGFGYVDSKLVRRGEENGESFEVIELTRGKVEGERRDGSKFPINVSNNGNVASIRPNTLRDFVERVSRSVKEGEVIDITKGGEQSPDKMFDVTGGHMAEDQTNEQVTPEEVKKALDEYLHGENTFDHIPEDPDERLKDDSTIDMTATGIVSKELIDSESYVEGNADTAQSFEKKVEMLGLQILAQNGDTYTVKGGAFGALPMETSRAKLLNLIESVEDSPEEADVMGETPIRIEKIDPEVAEIFADPQKDSSSWEKERAKQQREFLNRDHSPKSESDARLTEQQKEFLARKETESGLDFGFGIPKIPEHDRHTTPEDMQRADALYTKISEYINQHSLEELNNVKKWPKEFLEALGILGIQVLSQDEGTGVLQVESISTGGTRIAYELTPNQILNLFRETFTHRRPIAPEVWEEDLLKHRDEFLTREAENDSDVTNAGNGTESVVEGASSPWYPKPEPGMIFESNSQYVQHAVEESWLDPHIPENIRRIKTAKIFLESIGNTDGHQDESPGEDRLNRPVDLNRVTIEDKTVDFNKVRIEKTPLTKRFGIFKEDLETIPGFFDKISEEQRELIYENFVQLTLGNVREEAARLNAETAEEKRLNLVDKFGIAAKFGENAEAGGRILANTFATIRERFLHTKDTVEREKEVLSDMKEGGIEYHRELLTQLVENVLKYGPRVHKNLEGKLEVDLVNIRERAKGKLRDEEWFAMNELNKYGHAFARVPASWRGQTLGVDGKPEWGITKFFKDRFSPERKNQNAYAEVENGYKEARKAMKAVLEKNNRTEVEIAEILIGIDSRVFQLQTIQTDPEAMDQLASIEKKEWWKEAIKAFGTGPGAYMALGYVAKGAAVAGLAFLGAPLAAGVSLSVLGAPLGSAVIGGLRSRNRAAAELRERDRNARAGVIDTKEGALNVISAEDLTWRTQYMLDRCRKETDPTKLPALLAQLRARVEYANDKQMVGRVNYGKRDETVINQVALIEAIAEAFVYLAAEEMAVSAPVNERFKISRSRLKVQSDKTDKIITNARTQGISTEGTKGALISATFSLAGEYLHYHFNETETGTAIDRVQTGSGIVSGLSEAPETDIPNFIPDSDQNIPEIRVPEALVGPSAEAVPAFVGAPDERVVSSPLGPEMSSSGVSEGIPESYNVVRDDNVWNLLKKEMPEIRDLASENAQNARLAEYVNRLREMNPAQLKELGLGKDIGLIHPGDKINLAKIHEVMTVNASSIDRVPDVPSTAPVEISPQDSTEKLSAERATVQAKIDALNDDVGSSNSDYGVGDASPAPGHSAEELQSQIDSLMAQIKELNDSENISVPQYDETPEPYARAEDVTPPAEEAQNTEPLPKEVMRETTRQVLMERAGIPLKDFNSIRAIPARELETLISSDSTLHKGAQNSIKKFIAMRDSFKILDSQLVPKQNETMEEFLPRALEITSKRFNYDALQAAINKASKMPKSIPRIMST